MRWRCRLLSIGRTEIRLNPATVLFALYAALLGQGGWLLAGTASVMLHEGAHGAAAALLGCPPAAIEVTPLGALMRLEDEAALPPGKRAVMLLAGPAATLLLCWAALVLTRIGVLDRHTGRLIFMANLSILLITLLPALPLDGGRLLALLLSLRFRGDTVRRILRIIGVILGAGCVAGNILLTWTLGGWNLSLACAGCVLLYAAYATEQGDYGKLAGNIASYKVPLMDMFLFVCDQVDEDARKALKKCRIYKSHAGKQ